MNTYDIETFEENGNVVPYCVCGIINNKSFNLYFDDCENIIIKSIEIICLSSEENEIQVYIHNLNFDGMLIINEITKEKIHFEIKSRDTNLYYIDVFYMFKTIKFRCSYKILPMSLESLGKLESHPKTFFPHKFIERATLKYVGAIPSHNYWSAGSSDFLNIWPSKTLYSIKEEATKYCLNDVILLKKILDKIVPMIDEQCKNILKNAYSAPSMSHKLFFKKYNTKTIPEKIKIKDENFVIPTYFGGWTDVFGNPKKNMHVKYFDHSGMYASCMTENFHNGNGKYFSGSDYNLPGFHTILYNSHDNHIPILPCHTENGKLVFSNGKKIGRFWFEEIKNFKRWNKGEILEVYNSLVFDKYEKTFEDFIRVFDKIKEEGGYYKIFGKLVENGLYGSMALKSDDTFLYTTFSHQDFKSVLENFTVKKFYRINDVYIIIIANDYKVKNTNKVKNVLEMSVRNLSYSSAIASKARIKIYNTIKTVEIDGGRVLYIDTDSVFAEYPVEDLRPVFGPYKWLEFYDDAVFVSAKTYALKKGLKEEIRVKGVNTKNISFEEFKKNFYSNTPISFENQLAFKRYNFELKQLYSTKVISMGGYDKRIFSFDKKTTQPLTIHTYNE